MKVQKIMLMVIVAVLFSASSAEAMPLPADLSGYYKFGYSDGETYVAKVEQGAGTIKACVLPDTATEYLGVIQGDEIIFHDPRSPNWARLRQIDQDTALISAYDSETGDVVNEFSVVRITEAEADEIVEQTETRILEQQCVNNLKQLGLMLVLYARDHDDELPYDLAELYPNYASNRTIFVCPARGGEFRDFDMDYEYIPGFSLGSPNPSEEPVVIERSGNHSTPFHNVLYLDGHVERVEDY